MKLKALFLALLLPISAFGANTNAFDSVLIKNNLQITAGSPGVGKFWMSDAIGNGSWSLNASAFTNLNASSLASGTVPYARLPAETATNIVGGTGVTVTPASGTYTIALTSGGGTGDVFRALSNVYVAGTTQFMAFASVSNNLNVVSNLIVQRTGTINTNITTTGAALFVAVNDTTTTGIVVRGTSTVPVMMDLNVLGTPMFQVSGVGSLTYGGTLSSTITPNTLAFGGVSPVISGATGTGRSISLSQPGAGSFISLQASSTQIASFQTNMITLGTNSLVMAVKIGPNTTSRGQGIVVGSNTLTNSLMQGVSGTYGGSPTNITWPVSFAVTPVVVGSATTASGTALLNDVLWVTNKTTTGCTVGFRTSGGTDSAATLTFDVHAIGLQ